MALNNVNIDKQKPKRCATDKIDYQISQSLSHKQTAEGNNHKQIIIIITILIERIRKKKKIVIKT